MKSKAKKIVVTGCAGFLGTNLCLKLLKEGETVVGIDNMQTGQEKNLGMLMQYMNFIYYRMDVKGQEFLSLKELIPTVHQVYHLACPASPPKYQINPIDTMMTNVLGSKQVLDLAKYWKARVLLSSTSEIYGDPLISPQREFYRGNVNSCGPRSCYDEGKRAAESLFYDYKRKHKVDIRVARIFNSYGPYMDKTDGRVVTNFINQGLNKNPLTVYGTGLQTRSFCYVTDTIDGLYRLMNSNYFETPVNIGNTNEITIKKLATIISELLDVKLKVKNNELPEDDPDMRCPSIELAKEKIQWEPNVSLETGLKRTIEYFRDVK